MAGSGLQYRSFKVGQYVFREFEVGDLAFVVKSGAVEIVKLIDNNEIVLGTIRQGGIFGEMALIDDKPRMASARAIDEGTTVIVVTRDLFVSKLKKTDPFIKGLLNVLADHIRSLSSKGIGGNPKVSNETMD